jgi:hypothetical protein
MDDLRVWHGYYTTFNVTIFVKRVSNTNFEVSPPILHSAASIESCNQFTALLNFAVSNNYAFTEIIDKTF